MQQKSLKELPKQLLPWYQSHARDLPWRRTRNPYPVWVSEIMLQQTRVETVLRYYDHFLQIFPNLASLADADPETLHKCWEGLGYYRRCDNMQKAACVIMEQYNGIFPDTYEKILALPGIGHYTAGAICSICFDQKTPAVDGNVMRVLSRFTENEGIIDLPKTVRFFEDSLKEIYPDTDAGLFTQSLMELGATVCLPNGIPCCEHCPLHDSCLAAQHGSMMDYPKRAEKKTKRIEEYTVFIVLCKDRYAIKQRSSSRLLQGLWEFPNVVGILDEQAAIRAAESFGFQISSVISQINRTHVFTHIRWQMRCYTLVCDHETSAYTWASSDQLSDTYTLPTAFRKLLE